MEIKKTKRKLHFIYLAGFLWATHLASTSYINSSLIKELASDKVLNILYMASSLLGILSLFLAPFLVQKYGSLKSLIFFSLIKNLAVLGLAFLFFKELVMPLFVINISIDSIIYFFLDINLEKETLAESTTGRKRSFFLTIQNIAWCLSPLTLIFLVPENSFSKVYLFSGLCLFLFLIVALFSFDNIKEGPKKSASLKSIFEMPRDQKRIIAVQFVLNFFYAWMVIYLPLLLNQIVGFSWQEMGLLFPIMLLPFLIFEIPAGFLADKKFGEKEILIAGFIVMALATFFIPMIKLPIFWLWAIILFTTRIGASLVESSSESYFFKHVKKEDASLISLFRMVRPFAYILAPLIAIPIVYFFSYSLSFYFLSLFTLTGLLFIPKVDTK